MSTGAPTANSFTSPTAIVTLRVVLEPSVERASIVIAWLDAASWSRPAATVTTPLAASIAKRPPASSVST